jgi:hypothetical protein
MSSRTPTTPSATDLPPQNNDVRAAAQFLLWARRNGFAVTKIQLEGFSCDVADFRIADADLKGRDETPGEPAKSVHDALADEFGLPRPSDVELVDDPEGEDEQP